MKTNEELIKAINLGILTNRMMAENALEIARGKQGEECLTSSAEFVNLLTEAFDAKDSSNQWVSVEEFLKNPTDYCWAIFRNDIQIIVYGFDNTFYADDDMNYPIEDGYIKIVIPIATPQPPKG